MIEVNKKIMRLFWSSCLIVYIGGFLVFFALRTMHNSLFFSIFVMLLLEVMGIIFCYIFMYKYFSNACNDRTIAMLNQCVALPYIEEMQTFLAQSKNLWKNKEKSIEFLIANAYRYYGDFEKAHEIYQKLYVQKLTELHKFQMKIYESMMYMEEGNLTQAEAYLQQVLSSPKKERYVKMSVMKSVAIELQILEASIKYKKNEMDVQELLPILQSAREDYTATKLWKYRRIINVLEKEGRTDIALPYRNMISNISGDFLLLHNDVILGEGEVHE
ncbi:tetratricopeptide repeat protein [Amedibacillus sp. YH-ame6]